jgi:hypothetical protein
MRLYAWLKDAASPIRTHNPIGLSIGFFVLPGDRSTGETACIDSAPPRYRC